LRGILSNHLQTDPPEMDPNFILPSLAKLALTMSVDAKRRLGTGKQEDPVVLVSDSESDSESDAPVDSDSDSAENEPLRLRMNPKKKAVKPSPFIDFNDEPVVDMPLPPRGDFDPTKHVGRTEVYDFFNQAYLKIILNGVNTGMAEVGHSHEEVLELVQSTKHTGPFQFPVQLRYIKPQQKTMEAGTFRVELTDVSMFFESYWLSMKPMGIDAISQLPPGRYQSGNERVLEWSTDPNVPNNQQHIFHKMVLSINATNTEFAGRKLVFDAPPPNKSVGVIGYHVKWDPPQWLVSMGGSSTNFATHRWINPAVVETQLVYGLPSVDPTGILNALTTNMLDDEKPYNYRGMSTRFAGLFRTWIAFKANEANFWEDYIFSFLRDDSKWAAVASWGEQTQGWGSQQGHGRALYKTFPETGKVKLHAVDSWMKGVQGSVALIKAMQTVAKRLKDEGRYQLYTKWDKDGEKDIYIFSTGRAPEQGREGTCMLHATVRAMAIADRGRAGDDARNTFGQLSTGDKKMWPYAVLARRLAEGVGIIHPDDKVEFSKYAAGSLSRYQA